MLKPCPSLWDQDSWNYDLSISPTLDIITFDIPFISWLQPTTTYVLHWISLYLITSTSINFTTLIARYRVQHYVIFFNQSNHAMWLGIDQYFPCMSSANHPINFPKMLFFLQHVTFVCYNIIHLDVTCHFISSSYYYHITIVSCHIGLLFSLFHWVLSALVPQYT